MEPGLLCPAKLALSILSPCLRLFSTQKGLTALLGAPSTWGAGPVPLSEGFPMA